MLLFVGVILLFFSLKCFIFSGKLLFISVHDLKRPISTTTQIPFRERVSMKHLPPNSPQPRNPLARAPKHILVQKNTHRWNAAHLHSNSHTRAHTYPQTAWVKQPKITFASHKILDLDAELLLGFSVSPALSQTCTIGLPQMIILSVN